jgi:hypothetical protein
MFVETVDLLAVSNVLSARACNPDLVTVTTLFLPNFSDHVDVIDSRDWCLFDRISQRVIRKSANDRLIAVLQRAVTSLQRVYLRIKFLYWYNRINRDFVNRRSHKRYYPTLVWDNVTDLWAFRKGLQIITPYYLEIYRRHTRIAFHRWKMHIMEIRALMYRMLGKWRVKSARIRLSRLNARRFLQLTRPLVERVRRALRMYYWPLFKHACDLVLIRRHVRLLFRCWRTVVDAMRRGRMRVKQRTLALLRENVAEERRRHAELHVLCAVIQDKSALRHGFSAWMAALRQRALVNRVLNSYCQSTLYHAWRRWARAVQVRPPPSPRPRVRPPPSPTPPPQHAYRRRGSRLPRVPPHIVVPLMNLQSYALVHDPKISARDRAEFRIHRAARLDLKEETRERPEVVERIHQSPPPGPRHSVELSLPHRTSTPDRTRHGRTSLAGSVATHNSSASAKKPAASRSGPNPAHSDTRPTSASRVRSAPKARAPSTAVKPPRPPPRSGPGRPPGTASVSNQHQAKL